jgi:hypothetical protein
MTDTGNSRGRAMRMKLSNKDKCAAIDRHFGLVMLAPHPDHPDWVRGILVRATTGDIQEPPATVRRRTGVDLPRGVTACLLKDGRTVYRARGSLKENGKRRFVHLGVFDTVSEAFSAAEGFRRETHGEFRRPHEFHEATHHKEASASHDKDALAAPAADED